MIHSFGKYIQQTFIPKVSEIGVTCYMSHIYKKKCVTFVIFFPSDKVVKLVAKGSVFLIGIACLVFLLINNYFERFLKQKVPIFLQFHQNTFTSEMLPLGRCTYQKKNLGHY